ncbi:hypothetical protein B6D60_02955 [candidate division KSB1 bacterium 4484_87]|nr:MAG: hypothetical protein B6D60_02955 [candidate division KSB1 bacterium 4484_87]
MKVFHLFIAFIFSVVVLMFFSIQALAQDGNSKAKNTSAADSSSVAPVVQLEGDIVLEDINIEAVIEKPRVSIVPKRMNPEFGELEFVDRSFDHELKSFPQKALVKDDRLFKPQRVNKIVNKIIAQKNNKDKTKKTKNN